MIPKKLSDWDLKTIKLLLKQGYYECDYFDFKEMLPHTKDENGKVRLVKACCAFANQNGGFLVFGISDKKELGIDKRIVGIDSKEDFPEHFGNYPRKCSPSMEWEFLNPPIKISKSKVIHIVHIKQSLLSPVGFEQGERGWFFPKRTNKGDELMTYNEIKLYFMSFYEKRIKLQLLLIELETIKDDATELITPEQNLESKYSIIKFDLKVLESILGDTYTILYTEKELIRLLNYLRSTCRLVNTKLEIYHASSMLPISNRGVTTKEHNLFVNKEVANIIPAVDTAIQLLNKFTNTV